MEAPSSPSSTITAPPDYHKTARRLAKLIAVAMTCRFALLHYDSASKSMIEWWWTHSKSEGQWLQTELYVLSFLLKDRVYPDDLWEMVGECSIEAKQDETLRRHQRRVLELDPSMPSDLPQGKWLLYQTVYLYRARLWPMWFLFVYVEGYIYIGGLGQCSLEAASVFVKTRSVVGRIVLQDVPVPDWPSSNLALPSSYFLSANVIWAFIRIFHSWSPQVQGFWIIVPRLAEDYSPQKSAAQPPVHGDTYRPYSSGQGYREPHVFVQSEI
ncbi:hypothetical protein DFJ58DRAFT_837653 [Suillus subalutaceus]|uniref:uncharacterized protein n=1 Tax=Suillus subalutaceus TaxID=48586 RepID=UPI001B867397|nr:uncharacterized protein DFJ58DRAFT_837653 [Suillus subalutaceus]KAG1869345.1 hypothetical protein DFJ58DRAFT_837653 [Suillus subalutaceus]